MVAATSLGTTPVWSVKKFAGGGGACGWARTPAGSRIRKSAAAAHDRKAEPTLKRRLKERYFGEAAGDAPKLKFTPGGFSLPATDLKYGFSFIPKKPAKSRAGMRRMAVL